MSDSSDPGFNIVQSGTMGSTPVELQASAEQMRRLAEATPDIEGPPLWSQVETGDRRMLHPMAFQSELGLNTRQLPLPYMFGDERAEAHQKAMLGGWIIALEPVPIDDDGNYAIYTYTKLVESEFGQDIYDRFSRGEYRGVSADLDRVRAVDLEAGSVVDNGPVRVYIAARFMGMTAVTFPAFEEAGPLAYGEDRVLPTAGHHEEEQALVASGGQIHVPELQIVSNLTNNEVI